MISVKLLYRSPVKDDRSTSNDADEIRNGASLIILNDRNSGSFVPIREETRENWFGYAEERDTDR